jgi:hypothetical protein
MAKQTDDGLEFSSNDDWWQEDRVTTQLRAVEKPTPFRQMTDERAREIVEQLTRESDAWLAEIMARRVK